MFDHFRGKKDNTNMDIDELYHESLPLCDSVPLRYTVKELTQKLTKKYKAKNASNMDSKCDHPQATSTSTQPLGKRKSVLPGANSVTSSMIRPTLDSLDNEDSGYIDTQPSEYDF